MLSHELPSDCGLADISREGPSKLQLLLMNPSQTELSSWDCFLDASESQNTFHLQSQSIQRVYLKELLHPDDRIDDNLNECRYFVKQFV
ncbi:Protein of unknown function, partial [Gryllus bimaculatus]